MDVALALESEGRNRDEDARRLVRPIGKLLYEAYDIERKECTTTCV